MIVLILRVYFSILFLLFMCFVVQLTLFWQDIFNREIALLEELS